jgi:sugar lactone lactonase YvrE
MPDQSIIVSVPNFNDQKQPPLLVKITKDNQAEKFLDLQPGPGTDRFGPMGIRVAPSGDLYLSDNQLFHGKDGKMLFGKSRLVRIVMKDGKPTEIVPVAVGLNVANGIAIHGDYVYVTETILEPGSSPLVSGVFRFKLDDKDVQMKQPLKDDPHLVLTMETQSKVGFGADGICFDGKENLYVSDFSDGVIYKVALDKDGKGTKTLFAKADFMKSCDGMDYDPKTDKIYSADLMGNGVNVIDMQGKVERLAEDPDNDGSGGKLRAACEALVRGNTIVVANMDFPVPGAVIQKYTKPATISVIKLE